MSKLKASDYKDIEDMYIRQKMPMELIARKYRVSKSTICRYMKKRGIPARKLAGITKYKPPMKKVNINRISGPVIGEEFKRKVIFNNE